MQQLDESPSEESKVFLQHPSDHSGRNPTGNFQSTFKMINYSLNLHKVEAGNEQEISDRIPVRKSIGSDGILIGIRPDVSDEFPIHSLPN
jgi:hypothetical protein